MKNRIFRIVTGVAGGYHVLLAVAGLLCPVDEAVKVITMAFGITLEVSPQLSLILKFSSVYMLAFGIMLLILSFDPIKYRVLALPALIIFGIRLTNRILFFNVLTMAGISVSRNIAGTCYILFFLIAILFLLPKKQLGGQANAGQSG